MINNSKYLFNVYDINLNYVWLTYINFCSVVFHNKAESIETYCLLASIKHFILYTMATENCKSVPVVYLVASYRWPVAMAQLDAPSD